MNPYSFTTFVASREDIDACAQAERVHEVLLEGDILAREGRLSLREVEDLARYAKEHGLRTVLVWDILMTDADLIQCAQALASIDLTSFSAIRVQCIGAAHFIKDHYPHIPLQLIAETANCNLLTLNAWVEIFGTQLERLVLSLQLPSEKIVEYVQVLPVACELLAAGRILLFYSRRDLLRAHFSELEPEWREVVATAKESGDRPFSLVTTRHGTCMYLDKDQFILHKLEALREAFPQYLRLDLRHLHTFPRAAAQITEVAAGALSDPHHLRETWPRPTIAPFFKSNLTTKQFKLLNSELRYERDDRCIAEVLSSERERHLVVRALSAAKLPCKVAVLDPGGEIVEVTWSCITTLEGKQVTAITEDSLYLAPWLRKISVGSLVRISHTDS